MSCCLLLPLKWSGGERAGLCLMTDVSVDRRHSWTLTRAVWSWRLGPSLRSHTDLAPSEDQGAEVDRNVPLNSIPSSCFYAHGTVLFLHPHHGDPQKATSCFILALGRCSSMGQVQWPEALASWLTLLSPSLE